MSRFFKSRKYKQGLPPGSLVSVGDRRVQRPVVIQILDFSDGRVEESTPETFDACLPLLKNPDTVTWINIDGVSDADLIRRMGEALGIHQLVLEDIMNTDQRPKTEDYESYLFVVVKMLYLASQQPEQKDMPAHGFVSEQVSLLIGANYVISFQEEGQQDTFDAVRERIRQGKWKNHRLFADYLAYALIDSIVDNYFTVLESQGAVLEEVEIKLLDAPTPENLQVIHELKREMLLMRKHIWPLREVVHALQRSDSSLINDSTRVYLRDVYDHVVQVIDIMETYREMISGLMDVYLSSISNRMNAIMKVLTIISTLFIPLTFIVGVYGMNFKYMPELNWPWGYPSVWVVMLLTVWAMLSYFRRLKWI